MTQNEFMRQQQTAIEKMQEMSAKAKITTNNQKGSAPNNQNTNSVNNFIKNTTSTSKSSFDLPFSEFFKNGDMALILGLLLLLYTENADKKLLFALIYILL